MAKLGYYFGLCPIIDQTSLLGINEDCEPENVLVTLGKNIVIRYKLSDQKQIQSWRTKDKFTSPVIYDKEEGTYCATFNQTYLRTWKDEDNLDKLKKFKFQKQIHTLLSCGGKAFIVFQNGCITLLKKAFEQRKEFCPEGTINEPNDTILDVLSICLNENIYIGLLIKSEKKIHFQWTVFNNDNQSTFKILHISKPKVDLKGYVLAQMTNQEINLVTIWSDGKLYADPLDTPNSAEETFFTIMESLSCKENITMIPLNQDYIAMYGDNCNQEGASLIIYNVQFKVTQSQQSFKMFASGTKLWCLHNNLFLCVGQNLAVIPYHLDVEQLAALVGSHKMKMNSDPDVTIVQELVVDQWCETGKEKKKKGVMNCGVSRDIEEFIILGVPESTICEELFPKYMQSNDFDSIRKALGIISDIPEIFIAKLLNFVISADNKLFTVDKQKNDKVPLQLGPMERCYLLDKLLLLPSSEAILMCYLRTYLDLSNALLLLRYICYLLSEDGHILSKISITNMEEKLFNWGTILLDANYQKILLSRDNKIVEILIYFNNLLKAHSCCLDELQQIAPILREIKKGKSPHKFNCDASTKYSIEELKLF